MIHLQREQANVLSLKVKIMQLEEDRLVKKQNYQRLTELKECELTDIQKQYSQYLKSSKSELADLENNVQEKDARIANLEGEIEKNESKSSVKLEKLRKAKEKADICIVELKENLEISQQIQARTEEEKLVLKEKLEKIKEIKAKVGQNTINLILLECQG